MESNHVINILDRNVININGIKKIENFDNEEFLIDTLCGRMVIKGNDLELIKLDTKEDIITIKGIIISLSYIDKLTDEKETTVFSRLFK